MKLTYAAVPQGTSADAAHAARGEYALAVQATSPMMTAPLCRGGCARFRTFQIMWEMGAAA